MRRRTAFPLARNSSIQAEHIGGQLNHDIEHEGASCSAVDPV